MKVSLITATFNSEQSINSAIQSVNQQDYSNIEHVFIDGNSCDSTLDIIKSNSRRNPVIKSEEDYGIYDALNKGIQMATGEIIGFLHSDDLLHSPTTVTQIVKHFNHGKTDGVYGDLQYVNKDDPTKVIRYWKSKEFRSSLLRSGWMPPHPSLFLKKKIYYDYGLFDLKFKIAADYDFILRIFNEKNNLKFQYIPTVITKMRVGGASNKNVNNMLLKSKEDFRALKKNGIIYPMSVLVAKNLSKIPQFFLR